MYNLIRIVGLFNYLVDFALLFSWPVLNYIVVFAEATETEKDKLNTKTHIYHS